VTALLRGNLRLAHTHLERGLALYDPDIHDDVSIDSVVAAIGISIFSTCGWVLWLLGYPEQARIRCDEALERAQSLAHPYTLARTQYYHNIVHQLRREPQVVQAQAEIAIAVATEQAFAFPLALGTISQGWSLAVQGQGAEGLQQLRQGIELQRSTGGECLLPHVLALLSETYHVIGKSEEGLKVLSEALLVAETTGEQHYLAELYRLKGELILSQTAPDAHEAELCFQKALETARQQAAKSWELRAAMSLARLWLKQKKREQAHDLLAPTYNWFTEGFDTADLQDARALLDALALEM
jgi:predicted ATPase